jgi:crotonobetainyl-CoA:carnitine CoA-transferase CaiB-like acyl-CoA transferase
VQVRADSVPTPPRPLHGIRVLDLTSSLAGPTCTQILAALGADVVKVERPGSGDEARDWGPPVFPGGSAMFFAANAAKRSLVLDLKAPAGREALLRLAGRADVVVASLRPGAAERLGIAARDLRARNPRLVHCTLGAYGSGPLGDLAGYDPLLQAFAGILSVTGERQGRPVRVGVSLVDYGAGAWAALAILAALRRRDETGEGVEVQLSLLETALSLLGYHLTRHAADGTVPGPEGTAFPLIAPYEVFETADGALMIAAANDRLFAALCEALGLPELPRDPRFATNPLRVEHRRELRRPLRRAIRARPTAALLDDLHAAGVPAAPVQDVAQVAAHPQVEALGILERLPGGTTVDLPFALDGGRPRYASPPPGHGEHSEEVLREAGYSDDEVAALVDAGVTGKGPAR